MATRGGCFVLRVAAGGAALVRTANCRRTRRFFYDGCEGSSASRLRSVAPPACAPHLGRVLVSHWTLAQPASTRTTNPHGELDKNPGVNQAIAAVDGAAPTPPGTARTFSRFTAITARSRLTQIRPPLATSGGVCTTTTRRPFAAGFDTRPWSSTVAPTANGSAGAATGAATARGTRVVRWNGRGAGAGARRTRCVEVPRVRVVNARARRSAGESKTEGTRASTTAEPSGSRAPFVALRPGCPCSTSRKAPCAAPRSVRP